MKIRYKPAVQPHLRTIRKTNEGAGHPIHRPHPIKDNKFFRRKPLKKRKRK